MDAVDAWQETTENVLRELDVRRQIGVEDGDWYLPLEPHLPNGTIKWLNDFVPEVIQPEAVPTSGAPVVQSVTTVKPEQADAEVQREGREYGRKMVALKQKGHLESAADDEPILG